MAKRRTFTAEFKARVVLEMLVEGKSLAQASREYGIKDTVLSCRKEEFIVQSPGVFVKAKMRARSVSLSWTVLVANFFDDYIEIWAGDNTIATYEL